jgi:predicted phage terminase large subunit-like protein
LIEDKGSGQSLLHDLRADQVFAKAILPEGDKIVRMSACSAIIESGAVHLPHSATRLDEFRLEMLAFPQGKHDDQADALSQLLKWKRTKSTYTLDNL